MPISRVLPIASSVTVSPSETCVTVAAWAVDPPDRCDRPVSVTCDVAHPTRAVRTTSAAGRAERRPRLVVGTEAVPAVELQCLGRELLLALLGEPWHDRVDDGVARCLFGGEGIVAAEAGCDLQRLA